MSTFADLGIPFPLYEAPIGDCSEYWGLGSCVICKQNGFCFDLEVGCALSIPCSNCKKNIHLDTSDQEDVVCDSCKVKVEFPRVHDEQVLVCYECLRHGRGVISKDTEFGMISWEQAEKGITHGIPGLSSCAMETVPLQEGWVGVRVAPSMMHELLRTPTYSTWQGEMWLFCCKEPMVFLGTWDQREFDKRSPNGDGRKLFLEMTEPSLQHLWDDAEAYDTEETGQWYATYYVFRCAKCEKLRGNWDCP